MKTVSRRQMLKYVGLGAAGSLLAACQPQVVYETVEKVVKETVIIEGEEKVVEKVVVETRVVEKEAQPVTDSITLRFVDNHGGLQGIDRPGLKELLFDWQQEYPNIRVDYMNIGAGDEYYNVLNTQAVGGSLPDLFYCRTFLTETFASRGWIVNLSPYIEAHGIDTTDFWEALLAQMSWEGNQYSLPYDFSNMGFYYNKDILAEMGVDAPSDDWTWEDFEQFCSQLVELEDGKPSRWATTLSVGSWTFLGHLVANDGRLWTEDRKTCVLASEENIEVFEQLVQMRNRNIFPEGGIVPDGVDAWTSGLTVMRHEGSWATAGVRAQVEDKYEWDVAAMPMNSKTGMRALSAAGGAWSVGVHSDHPDEAFLLCDWVSNTAALQKMISEPVRSIPGRKSAVDLWVQNATAGGLPPANVEVFARQMEDEICVEPYPPFWQDFDIIWNNRIPSLVFGGGDQELDVREHLTLMQEEIQDVIDRYWAAV